MNNNSNNFTENGLDDKKLRIIQNSPSFVEVGSFKVSFIPTSHSVPEAASLLIETPLGRIFHTGDLKVDYSPVLGDPFQDKIIIDGLQSLSIYL